MKRIISVCLISILVFALSGTVAALYNEDELSNQAIVSEQMEKILGSIFDEKEDYALSYNDYDELSLGTAIRPYELLADGPHKLNFEYYTVWSSNDLVGLALTHLREDGTLSIRYTTELVDEISVFIQNNNTIALVYDYDTVYAYSDGKFTQLSKYNPFNDSQRTSLEESPSELLMSDKGLEVSEVSLEPLVELNPEIPQTRVVSKKNLNIPVLTQLGSDGKYDGNQICWACCSASVGRYLTGDSSYNGWSLAMDYCGSYNISKSVADITTILSRYYGLTYNWTASVMDIDTLATEDIAHNRPVILRVGEATWVGSGHFIVARGYDLSADTVSLMDPLSKNYSSANVNARGELDEYISPFDGSVTKFTHMVYSIRDWKTVNQLEYSTTKDDK